MISKVRLGAAMAVLVFPFAAAVSFDRVSASGRAAMAPTAATGAALRRFEINEGQFAPGVRFAARSKRTSLLLLEDGALLGGAAGTIDMRWGTSRQVEITPLDPLPGVTNYLTGSDPSRWRRNVRGYGRVQYANVAPGIGLEFYGVREGFEYDITVAPGADLGAFVLRFGSSHATRVDAGGDLVVATNRGALRQHRPIAFQMIDGRRVPVDVRYELRGGAVHLRAAAYDRTRTLVIDPVLEFATYLGGTGNDAALATAVDGAGNIYVAGSTASTDFPLAAAMMGDAGSTDAFVAKVSPDGSTLIYSTYLGGSGADAANGLAVTSAGSAYLTGSTASTDFPLASAMQASAGTGTDAFVARLDTTGSTLVFSTYLGGNGDDAALGVAVDAAGGAYVTGTTRSTDFPLLSAFQGSVGSSFVAKLTATGSLAYSTYFGGPGTTGSGGDFNVALRAISVDSAGAAYVAGESRGTSIPVTGGAFQTTPGPGNCPFLRSPMACSDALVAKLSPAGQLAYGTYLRETTTFGRHDGATAIAVDGTGAAYVSGYTTSPTFPTTAGAYRETCLTSTCGTVIDVGGGNPHTGEVFVTKLNPAGSGLIYSTLLGGLQGQAPTGIALDKAGYATVTGQTRSTDFPVVNAHQPTMGSSALLRTTDAGATWTSAGGPPGRIVDQIAVAADGALYARARVGTSSIITGLFKSTDAGHTWTRLLEDAVGMTLSLDPNNASVLYANGLKSTDAGATWTPIALVPGGFVANPLVRPGASNVLYATGNSLFKSIDGGSSWAFLSTFPSSGSGPLTLRIAPSAPDTMYIWSSSALNISIDGGASWSPRTVPAIFTNSLVIDPSNASILYASYDVNGAQTGVARSIDGGATWQTTLATINTHVDGVAATSPTTVIASAADLSVVNFGGFVTLYRSTDAGQTWTPVRTLRTGGQFAANPAAPSQGFEINASFLDGFVTTVTPDGSALAYSSFIGGSDDDAARGVAITPDGALAVAGQTQSRDFPATSGALQPSNAGGPDAFLLKLRYPLQVFTIDAPANGTTQTSSFKITGSTLDRGSAAGCGIDGVHVWAYPPSGPPMFIAAATPSVSRPDIQAVYGSQFSACGFEVPIAGLASGTYLFALTPHSTVTNAFGATQVRSVTISRQTIIALNPPAPGSTTYRGAKLGGWALDRFAASGTGVDAVHVWAYPNPGSGAAPVFVGVATIGVDRPDVGAVYGSQFNSAGYELLLPSFLTPGTYLFVASPHSSITGAFDPPATTFAAMGVPLRSSIDTPANGATIAAGTNLGGWVIDLASSAGPGIDTVHVWAYPNPGSGQPPVFVGVAGYGVPRGDIGAVYGSQFTNSGFNLNLSLPPGTYLLVVSPHSTVTGAFDAPRTLVVTIQ